MAKAKSYKLQGREWTVKDLAEELGLSTPRVHGLLKEHNEDIKAIAPNDTRNLVFQDIKRLENARKEDSFSQGRFYMITDLQTYANKSKKGLGTVFRIHDGAETQANEEFYYPDSTSKKNVKVTLDDPYSFNWEKIDKKTTKKEEWYFLEIPVLKTRTN